MSSILKQQLKKDKKKKTSIKYFKWRKKNTSSVTELLEEKKELYLFYLYLLCQV